LETKGSSDRIFCFQLSFIKTKRSIDRTYWFQINWFAPTIILSGTNFDEINKVNILVAVLKKKKAGK